MQNSGSQEILIINLDSSVSQISSNGDISLTPKTLAALQRDSKSYHYICGIANLSGKNCLELSAISKEVFKSAGCLLGKLWIPYVQSIFLCNDSTGNDCYWIGYKPVIEDIRIISKDFYSYLNGSFFKPKPGMLEAALLYKGLITKDQTTGQLDWSVVSGDRATVVGDQGIDHSTYQNFLSSLTTKSITPNLSFIEATNW